MMHRWLVATLASLLLAAPAHSAESWGPGRLDQLGTMPSRFADPRKVVVWLPDDYDAKGPPYAVLYMHDGQNLFDPATGYGGKEWKVDEVVDRLVREGKMRRTIVVGIWNTPTRLRDYVPSKAFTHLPRGYMNRVRGLYGGDPLSDGYLKFIVRELKPLIDKRYNVATGRADTAIMGSSMGGLISLYAINEYPEVFGGAGMVSTHWPLFLPSEGKSVSDAEYEIVSSAFETYLRPSLAGPQGHLLYFDHGSETLDRNYARYQERIDRIVKSRGYRRNTNWISRNFPGAAHNEDSWAARVEIPLRFLLPPRRL